MKYEIKGEFDATGQLKGSTQVQDCDMKELQFFLMDGFPSIYVDLLKNLTKGLDKKGMKDTEVLYLTQSAVVMCAHHIISEGLKLLNKFSGKYSDEKDEEEIIDEDKDFNLFDRLKKGGTRQEK